MKRRRYAFVAPRYGESIVGGAEALMRLLAQRLAARGDQITVLTTCACDNRSWENSFAAGVTEEGGITVRRFLVDPRNLECWIPIQIAISEGMRPSIDQQLDWMAESVNSTELYEHIAAQHGQYDALFFGPYLFGVTFWGSQIIPEKSILIPCLHDEHYAYLPLIAAMFRSVSGALFNALPERDLARALYGDIQGGEVGLGFDMQPFEAAQSIERRYFADDAPYLFYAGRKETGKNLHLLIDYFIEGKLQGWLPAGIKFVVAGGGSFEDLHRPHALERDDIVDLGQVSEEDKLLLMRDATALCLLSTNESFSMVLMESWAMETPVIVHSRCEVTRHHVLDSGGGLPVKNGVEFCSVVNELLSNPKMAAELAWAGKRYVERRYSWNAVLERFDEVLAGFLDSPLILEPLGEEISKSTLLKAEGEEDLSLAG